MPKSPKFKIAGIVYARSFHVAALSPVQCAVYLPEVTKVDLESINGLLPVTLIKAALVVLDSRSPYRLWALYSVMLPQCKDIAGTVLLLMGRKTPALLIL